jgi:hypothetical protein
VEGSVDYELTHGLWYVKHALYIQSSV